jgi:hypothetical protein
MTELQRHIEKVLRGKGSFWLEISSKHSDDSFLQFVREEETEDGKPQFEVLISYPFAESAEKTLGAAGIFTPKTWRQVSFVMGDGGELEYEVTGADATAIANFIAAVFLRLFKGVPDVFKLSEPTEMSPVAEVPASIPLEEADFSSNRIEFGDDQKWFGRLALGICAVVATWFAYLCHHRSNPWWLCGCVDIFACCFAWTACWRRKVIVDLTRNVVVVATGPLIPVIERTYPLADFHKCEVQTIVELNTGYRGPDKINRKFYLVGKKRVMLFWRCHLQSDQCRAKLVDALEKKLRTALGNRLGKEEPRGQVYTINKRQSVSGNQ